MKKPKKKPIELEFPKVDTRSWFYKNCKRQRKIVAKICQVCPFRAGIEQQEKKPKDVPEWVKKAIIPHYKNAKGSKR